MKNYLGINLNNLNNLSFKNTKKYLEANPFPHIYFDNVFPNKLLEEILMEFKIFSKHPQIAFNEKFEKKKYASLKENQFGEKTKQFLHFLNSAPFLEFLEVLTGIKNLIPDPDFEGGGYHEIKKGGYLKIHADFNKHPKTHLDRRLNILIYLNKNWKEEYGGHFELWNRSMANSVIKVLPIFNRLAIFSTTEFSYHGHPDPLNCPANMSRKSLALYYYTNGRPKNEIISGIESHNTIFKLRPEYDKDLKLHFDSLKKLFKDFIPPIFFKIKNKF